MSVNPVLDHTSLFETLI